MFENIVQVILLELKSVLSLEKIQSENPQSQKDVLNENVLCLSHTHKQYLVVSSAGSSWEEIAGGDGHSILSLCFIQSSALRPAFLNCGRWGHA